MNRPLSTLAAITLLAMASTVQAQSAGSYSVRAGYTRISPHVSSGNLSAPSIPGTQVDIDADGQLGGGVTYMVTNQWALDIPIALPFTHDINGAGAIAGVGKIGETKALPISAFLQYRFGEANAKFRPYLGAGPTYAKFYKERGTSALNGLTGGSPATPTTLSIESKLALSIQVGATFALNDRWFVDAMVAKTFLKTRTTLSTGQTIDTRLDPLSVSVAVGYRF